MIWASEYTPEDYGSMASKLISARVLASASSRITDGQGRLFWPYVWPSKDGMNSFAPLKKNTLFYFMSSGKERNPQRPKPLDSSIPIREDESLHFEVFAENRKEPSVL
jgi:hypothetical protein